ncbi:DNA-binding protein WhiA [uncultured Clostridium sp.]|uniref:DNA-binding protein WhiA n=1 Tax=uncultured Clostridium sp. TaxID=59620 RepID=UPI00272E86E1|nr:DNA-binding protein WhiA [uncultured Clostridium sp.]
MTYTTRIKEEIAKNDINDSEKICELSGFIRFAAVIKDNISITLENASITRRIYKHIKEIFNIQPRIIIRNQKRFRIKQIYILEINEKVEYILNFLNVTENKKKILPTEYFLTNKEEKIAYLQGVFLASGTINDPASSGYHLEIVTDMNREAIYITNLFKDIGIIAKHIKRNSKYMIYIKNAEVISEIIRMFKATTSYFYFEDIRIYRDHKNMVNRLNNCEIANQEKTINTGLKQLDDIKYLKENDLYSLLEDTTKIVLDYREKYPETSLKELADIISLETDYTIGKSGVNHHFIKVRNLIKKHKEKTN